MIAVFVAAAQAQSYFEGGSVLPIDGQSVRGGAADKFRCDNKCDQLVGACVTTVDCSKQANWNAACGSSVTKVNAYYQCVKDVAGPKDDTCKNDTPDFCTQSKPCTCKRNIAANSYVCTAGGVAANSNPITKSKQCP